MKSNSSWSLFRLSDRKQFDRVDLATIDFFFRALPHALHSDWLMWREGFSGWRPFSDLPSILKHLQKGDDPVVAPPPIPASVLQLADETAAGIKPSAEVIVKETSGKMGPEHEHVIEAVPEISVNTNSKRVHKEKSDDFAVPESAPVAAASLENTQSSVSIRALQAAATSSLKLKTVSRMPSSDPVAQHTSTKSGMRPEGRVLNMPDEATLSLMLESQAATEDRNNVRYQKKFKLRIFTPKGVVNMATIDCSTSGFRLKEPLPQGLPRFFHVELDLGPEGKIPLVCSEVKEKDGRPATRVRIQVNDHMNTLKSALMKAS